MDQIQIVVAHSDRATLRVGDVFLKIDTSQARTDVEVQAMAMAPVPTPEILWRRPPGCLDTHAARRTAAPGPVPVSTSARPDSPTSAIWLIANDVLPVDVVTRDRRLAETVLRPWTGATGSTTSPR